MFALAGPARKQLRRNYIGLQHLQPVPTSVTHIGEAMHDAPPMQSV
jgi:hypothetical protein